MNLSSLKPVAGSKRNRKRKGRGPGSGLGKTSGRGQDGAGSRKGAGMPVSFEGGQMPLQRRLPKRGFRSRSPKQFQIVNLSDLEKKCDGKVTNKELAAVGLIKKPDQPVKVLGTGALTKALKIKVNCYSASAKKAIEAANGVAEVA
ncbi:50S ribosomal protein L15 [Fibrobacterota bacterium]